MALLTSIVPRNFASSISSDSHLQAVLLIMVNLQAGRLDCRQFAMQNAVWTGWLHAVGKIGTT